MNSSNDNFVSRIESILGRKAVLLAPEVEAAISCGRGVVILESSVLAQGLPFPSNLEAQRRCESAIRAEGAVPATVAVLRGTLRIGLCQEEIKHLAEGRIPKLGGGDLAPTLARGGDGATTVSATLAAAKVAGVNVIATGGIGGVHRGAGQTFDISADLQEIAQSEVATVCSGAKSVLDLPKTLEMLETLGIPVVGYTTNDFPGFYCAKTGLTLGHRVDTPAEAAKLMFCQWKVLGRKSGIVFTQPPPTPMPLELVEEAAHKAIAQAETAGIGGKELTPFLLRRLENITAGQSLGVNLDLLEANAKTAAKIAMEYDRLHMREDTNEE